jgi:hypothetical protein
LAMMESCLSEGREKQANRQEMSAHSLDRERIAILRQTSVKRLF